MISKILIVAMFLVASAFQAVTPATAAGAIQVADARQDAANQFFKEALKLYRANDLDGALESFELGLGIDPDNAVAHFYVAKTLQGLSRNAKALIHFQKAAALAPDTREGIMAGAILKRGVNRPKVGDVFRDCDNCPEMVTIPTGRFTMGSDRRDDVIWYGAVAPAHKVEITYIMAVGKYEISEEEWRFIVGGKSNDISSNNLPVVEISWGEIQHFLERLNKKLGLEAEGRYRLPSEAEWEYALRAGTQTLFSCGGNIVCLEHHAWHNKNSKGKRHAVGIKAPNAWGFHDMNGNVAEYVADCWNETHRGAPLNGRARTTGDCLKRIARGGSFFEFAEYMPHYIRSGTAADRDFRIGFRVVKTILN